MKTQRNHCMVAAGFILIFSVISCTSSSQKDPPNTLRLPTPEKIKGLDPAQADDKYSGEQVGMAYEGLLQYHYLKRPLELIPNLAESMPIISKDRKTITIKIKKGVLFQDDPSFKETQGKGRELIANDVEYSFKRLADPKLRSPGFWIFDGKIAGLKEWQKEASDAGATDYAKQIEGLRVMDRYTIQIQLKEPSAQFLYYLAMPFAYIVAREVVETYGQDFIRHPVGTGPFKLVTEETNLSSKLVWVKNPTFRKEFYPEEGTPADRKDGALDDAGQPLPRSDKIVFQVFTEGQPKWLNFLAGNLDWTTIPKDSYDQAIGADQELTPELKQKHIKIIKEAMLDITHETFNLADPIIGKNKLLRQALSMAVNPEPFIRLFYNGLALSAQGPIPPGIAGYEAEFKNPYRQYNLEKAKELLAKAGYPGGKGLPPLEYNTLTSSTYRQMSEYLTKSFTELGVNLKINTYTWPEFLANIKNRRGQMWGYAWSADYPDAENFLQLFYSKNVSPGPNDSNYANPEFDRLYESSLKLQDSPKRTEIYKRMTRLLAEDCPWIFEVHRINYELIQPWTKNIRINNEHTRFKYFRVDPALKTAK